MAYEALRIPVRFLIVLSIEFMQCKANVKSVKLRSMSYISGMLPTSGNCFVSELEDTRLTECSLRCSMTVCAGVFYNKDLKSCKLLRLNCNENVLYAEQAGWNFFSDISSCDEGWVQYRDHCYFIHKTARQWDEAVYLCQSQRAYLVEIESAEENKWIQNKTTGLGSIWTGGTDKETDGVFIWNKSKKAILFTNWDEEEPNGNSSGNDCLEFVCSRGFWYARSCAAGFPFLCEKTF